MQRLAQRSGRWKQWLWLGVLLVLLWCMRKLIWTVLVQLLYGGLVALAALPLMRALETKCRPGLAASLSITGLVAGLATALLLVIPALARQAQLLVSLLPGLTEQLSGWVKQGEGWLEEAGFPMALRQPLLAGGATVVRQGVSGLLSWAQQAAGGISRWLLAPVFGFYFLRDRRLIGEWLLLLLPVEHRALCVRLLREIRRETAGYLRGQLLLSLTVGGLTAVGLGLCGIPAWLLLGAVMGVMELIPYVGPFVGGVVVVLFSLQAGMGRMLWALAVVLAVQQLEGSWLSPQMMGDATRLHPVAVLAIMAAGSSMGGVAGLLLAVPLALCLRAVLRVAAMRTTAP